MKTTPPATHSQDALGPPHPFLQVRVQIESSVGVAGELLPRVLVIHGSDGSYASLSPRECRIRGNRGIPLSRRAGLGPCGFRSHFVSFGALSGHGEQRNHPRNAQKR